MNKLNRCIKSVAVIVTLLVLTISLAPNAYADENKYTDYSYYYDYVIENFDVKIIAHNDNTYTIKETIDVYHLEERHGIFRDIPLMFGDIRTRVKQIDVGDEQKKVTWTPTLTRIRLGDPDEYVTGKKRYTIKYELDMGEDQGVDVDSVYLDIIGTGWGTPILDAQFEIDLNELDNYPDHLYFHAGPEGATDFLSYIEVKQNDGIVSGYLISELNPYEGITIKADMQEGTFKGDKDPLDIIKVIGYSVGLIILLLLICIRVKNKKDEELVPIIEYYSPDKLNPAEIGYVIDEMVDNEDVGAMIIYWASHGHLKIEEGKGRKFTLIKTSPIDDIHTSYEKKAFKKLFKLGDGKRVESKELINSFYSEANKIKYGAKMPYRYKGARQLFTDVSEKAARKVLALGAICMFFIILLITWVSLSIEDAPLYMGVVFGLMIQPVYLGLSLLYKKIIRLRNKRKTWRNMLAKLCNILVMIGGYFLIILYIYKNISYEEIYVVNTSFMNIPLIGISFRNISIIEISFMYIVSMLAIFFSPNMRKYTDKGRKLTERVIGFKQFLEGAEKEHIKYIFDENPFYFYDVLPYAIVLGVSDKWAKKFESLSIEPPNWYRTYRSGPFNYVYFMNNIQRTINQISYATTSSPRSSGSSSSGGFSSGGGFSGGGGGGGGGGTW